MYHDAFLPHRKARVVRSESDGSFTLTLSVPELERAFGKKFKSKTKYKKTNRNNSKQRSALPFFCQHHLVLFQTTGKRCHRLSSSSDSFCCFITLLLHLVVVSLHSDHGQSLQNIAVVALQSALLSIFIFCCHNCSTPISSRKFRNLCPTIQQMGQY